MRILCEAVTNFSLSCKPHRYFLLSDVYHIGWIRPLWCLCLHSIVWPWQLLFFRNNRIFWVYYYSSDVRCHIILVATDKFVLMLCLPISNIMAPYVLSPMNISAYDFFSPIYFFFVFSWDWPCPHFQHAICLRLVSSVIYLCVSSSWSRQRASQINPLVNI